MLVVVLIGVMTTLRHLLGRFENWINQHDLASFYGIVHQEWIRDWIVLPSYIIWTVTMAESLSRRNAKYNVARFALIWHAYHFVVFQVQLEPFMLVSYCTTAIVVYFILGSAINDAERSHSSYNVEIGDFHVKAFYTDLDDSLALQNGKAVTVTLTPNKE